MKLKANQAINARSFPADFEDKSSYYLNGGEEILVKGTKTINSPIGPQIWVQIAPPPAFTETASPQANLAAEDFTNLFLNAQWQIIDNSAAENAQIGPNSIDVLPIFTVTGSTTGSAWIWMDVAGCPFISKNDLVGFTEGVGASFFKAKPDPTDGEIETLRVLDTRNPSGTCVTAFKTVAWLANKVPESPLSGKARVVSLGDLGTGKTKTGQYWRKTPTLQY